MPSASPNPSRGAQAGKYQKPKPRPATFRRVTLRCGDDEPTYFWDSTGRLFFDAELTKPAGLWIVELPGEGDPT
jgi:hypothetical protein